MLYLNEELTIYGFRMEINEMIGVGAWIRCNKLSANEMRCIIKKKKNQQSRQYFGTLYQIITGIKQQMIQSEQKKNQKMNAS